MNTKLLPWVCSIIAVAMVCLSFLLYKHIDPTPFVALVGATLTPLVAALLYSKVDKIEQQTNGTNANLMAMVNGVLEHLKTHNTIPMPPAPVKVTSTVESSTQQGSTVDVQPVRIPDAGAQSN